MTRARRRALNIRGGGCVFAGCDRPPDWCDAYHLTHWIGGGPTDLGNLALLCRHHHMLTHEGGWMLTRQPDGTVTAQPPWAVRALVPGQPFQPRRSAATVTIRPIVA